MHGLSQQLMPDAQMALVGHILPEKIIKTLFGNIPQGHENIAYLANQKKEWPMPSELVQINEQGKQIVPPGKGIHIKSGR